MKIDKILQLGGANIVSQVLPFTTVVFITRLYTPQDFALFGSMTAYASVAIVICTLRLEHSLISIDDLQLKKVIAGSVIYISLIISVILSFFYVLFLSVNHVDIFIFCVGLILSMSFYNLLTNFSVSIDDVKGLIHARLIKGFFDAFLPLIFYYIFDDYRGLVLGLIFSYFFSVLIIFIKNKIKIKIDWAVLKKYINTFSRYDVMSGALSTSANAIPVIAIAAIYSPTQAGAFAFLNRYFAAIASFSVNTLGVIYRTSAMQEIKSSGIFYQSTIKTILYGLVISIIFLIVIFIAYTIGIDKILGKEWALIGSIIFYLGAYYAVKIIHLPVIYGVYLKNDITKNLVIQVLFFLTTLIAIAFAFYIQDFMKSVIVITFILSIFYILNTIYIIKLSKSS